MVDGRAVAAVVGADAVGCGIACRSSRINRSPRDSTQVDATIGSLGHGKTKPHASIFAALLELLDVAPADAAMVGDTLDADIEGALALGMRAVLVDRLGVQPEYEPRIDNLYALPAALGLPTL